MAKRRLRHWLHEEKPTREEIEQRAAEVCATWPWWRWLNLPRDPDESSERSSRECRDRDTDAGQPARHQGDRQANQADDT